MRKKILLSFLTVLLTALILQWGLLTYGIRQGLGQLNVIRNAIPISEVLNDKSIPDSLKVKISLIQTVKHFAVEELGLSTSENYSSFYNEGSNVTLWNVSACMPYALEAKTWWFPIVGSVPYKGFFEKERAMKLVEELESEGWDVRMRPVGGWSTLGWFNDPILSSMLKRSDGQLAELIIHELTHGVIFVKDEVEFNENLASFIGEQGAIHFLTLNNGTAPEALQHYLNSESDSRKFRNHLLIGTKKLDSLYQSFENDFSELQKEELKQEWINTISTNLDTISFSNPRYKTILSNAPPNNAYFMSFTRYHSSGDSLQKIFKDDFNENLADFIQKNIQLHGRQ